MPKPRPLPAELRHTAFTRADATRFGIGPERLRRRDIDHPFHGVAAHGLTIDDDISRCSAYLPRLGPKQLLSHLTAARLLGMPLPSALRSRTELHVTAFGGENAPEARGIVGHEVSKALDRSERVQGIPVTTAAATWIDLAALRVDGRVAVGRSDLVAIGDFLVSGARLENSKQAPLCTLEELTEAVDAHGHRRGAAALAWALPRVRVGVDSPKESELRLLLTDARLAEPETNLAVHMTDGAMWHLDMGFRAERVGLEYEGDRHRTDRNRWLSDLTRTRRLQAMGWVVFRVGADDLRGEGARMLVADVRRALRSARREPRR